MEKRNERFGEFLGKGAEPIAEAGAEDECLLHAACLAGERRDFKSRLVMRVFHSLDKGVFPDDRKAPDDAIGYSPAFAPV